ncbi:efflux RND transporter periplasmic adaptor subunit [Aeoliella mucimassa]|uniref:HlyD family secretion protein n=1 Tax=Aeoliella mucimassa TaxID=2527972 RepID=A0A518AJF2_9BACT|nr:HlyD family efflux transporter periplasmic adaptor subunit [Aeoliella mucimassa]QDU54859.1 hypothetical protein Pan181_10430 [Aeoliella mucimassa]
MKALLLAIMMSFAGTMAWAQGSGRANPVLGDCQLSLLPENYIEVSADKAGKIKQMMVRVGSLIDEEQVFAQLDDVEARMQVRVAEQKLASAKARALDTIEEKYARAAADAAKATYDDLVAANSGGIDNVVPTTDLRAKKLEWVRAMLQIEKAQKDRDLAVHDYQVAKVEAEAAEVEVQRRVVTSPLSGQVVDLFRKQGEWVEPGEPILQLAKYDVLQCEGSVNLAKYDPREVQGCKVTIKAEVGLGRIEEATGRITYVEQQVLYDGDYTYKVLAEIPNREDRGRWALYPGLRATMTIHLGTATAGSASRIEGRGLSRPVAP